MPAPLDHERFELRVADRACVVQELRERKARIGMLTRADRPGQQRQEIFRKLDDPVFERTEVRGEALAVGIVPCVQLGREAKQPRPSVRALERTIVLRFEVRGFGGEILGRQILRETLPDLRCERAIGVELQQSHEHPMSVH